MDVPTLTTVEETFARNTEDLRNYTRSLYAAMSTAELQYTAINSTEENLTFNFVPAKRNLEAMIEWTVNEAGRAEAKVVLERLKRVHYEQVGQLERSARYWEEEIAKEKELVKVAEAKGRLEKEAQRVVEFQADLNNRSMHEVRDAEKGRLDQWLANVSQQLYARRSEVNDEILEEQDFLRRWQLENEERANSTNSTNSTDNDSAMDFFVLPEAGDMMLMGQGDSVGPSIMQQLSSTIHAPPERALPKVGPSEVATSLKNLRTSGGPHSNISVLQAVLRSVRAA